MWWFSILMGLLLNLIVDEARKGVRCSLSRTAARSMTGKLWGIPYFWQGYREPSRCFEKIYSLRNCYTLKLCCGSSTDYRFRIVSRRDRVVLYSLTRLSLFSSLNVGRVGSNNRTRNTSLSSSQAASYRLEKVTE